MEKLYPAIAFRQRANSPIQIAFVAPSSQIDAWARVPTKRTGNIRNFQRAEIENHIAEVQKFFEDDSNCSPTSVVIGFDPVRSSEKISIIADGEELDLSAISAGETVTCEIRINWDDSFDPQGREENIEFITNAAEKLRPFIFSELSEVSDLSEESLSVVEQEMLARAGEVEDEEEHGDDDPPEYDDGGNESEDEGSLDELSEALSGLSPSERQVVKGRIGFLCQLDEQSLARKEDDEIKVLCQEVADELKPGILIDGQHRVTGTRKLDRIPFLVTAIPDATWPELAFQFIVTNRTSRRVPESLLISIIGNSLSPEQRGNIETRLRQANIRVGLIEAVMQVHEDEQSPFYGLLAFGLKGEGGFLDAAAVRTKVVNYWYERKGAVKDLFDHTCDGRTVAARTEYWMAEAIWFDYFIAFWTAVRERYDGSAVFSSEVIIEGSKKKPVSKLMTATVLKIFQETILNRLLEYLRNKKIEEGAEYNESLPNTDAFHTRVKNSLVPLTPDFFTGWQLSGFDGSKNAREDLAEAIRLVLDRDKTVAQLKQDPPHRLFKELS